MVELISKWKKEQHRMLTMEGMGKLKKNNKLKDRGEKQ